MDANGVFASNELDLKEVDIYGFDYDYTLACYKESVGHLIYNLGRDKLVSKLKYPEEILQLNYQPGFAVRGLHYDINKGLLLKVDSFAQIQLGCVYRGLTPVPDEEVLRLYNNRYIPINYLEGNRDNPFYRVLAYWSILLEVVVYNDYLIQGSSAMAQLADLFSVPEMSLLCNITEYFVQNHIDYHPDILFRDVKVSKSCVTRWLN